MSNNLAEVNGRINYYNKQKRLFYEKNRFYGFKKIDDERKNEIQELATLYNIKHPDNNIYNIYADLNNYKYLDTINISKNDETFLYFILIFDPDLKVLQIYYEESTKDGIAKRFTEEFGCKFDNRILQIEKEYNKRFPTIIDEFSRSL